MTDVSRGTAGADPSGPDPLPDRPDPLPDRPDPLPDWLVPSAAVLDAYAGLLGTVGVQRGLLGPREVSRLWRRHLLNCLVVADPAAGLVPPGCVVCDIGSGAGLPGLAWALARPDLRVVLVEPLLRRATFLSEAVTVLQVGDRVAVRRARAEELVDQVSADVVTARAVAPLDRLVGWAMPLLRPGGVLLALKGAAAADEVATARKRIAAAGGTDVAVLRCGTGPDSQPTTVVRVVRGVGADRRAPATGRGRPRQARRGGGGPR